MILKPCLRRLGSMAAVFLVAQGIPEDTVTTIITGLSVGGLVGADLILSAVNKEKEIS